MKRFYQREWQGISFDSFAKLSSRALAGAEFYSAFYRALFSHKHGYDDLDQAWCRQKAD
jgi:hypothetical protein